eukprot:XP_011680367.1 PREDICTED: uncharacterized protein LOC105445919 [Strongylocentrotus purpuratus]
MSSEYRPKKPVTMSGILKSFRNLPNKRKKQKYDDEDETDQKWMEVDLGWLKKKGSPTFKMSRMPENSVESLFLQATERGDRKAIIFALENAPDLNVNCTDADGNSALVVAIQNGNSDEWSAGGDEKLMTQRRRRMKMSEGVEVKEHAT